MEHRQAEFYNLQEHLSKNLAILSERELKVVEDSVGVQFKNLQSKNLRLAIAPIGKTFLQAVTPIVKVIGNLLENFNGLSDGTKKFIVIATTLVGLIGPTLLMTFGLVANGVANIIKLFLAMRVGFLKLGGNSKILANQTDYLNTQQMEAATVAASLNQAHTRLTQSFTAEASAVRLLRQAYIDATVAAANFARANPGMMMPGRGGATPKKFARGTTYVPGSGNKDNVPAVLMPGEAVIPTDIAQDPRFQPIIDAMVSGKLQAFENGTNNAQPNARKTVFAHAVDNRVLKGGNVPANISAAGFNAATAFSAIGFDLDPSVNARLIPGKVPVSEYLKQLRSPLSTETMTGRLIDMGASPSEAARVTGQMKNNLIRSLESLPPNQLIGDKDIYSRMGNLKTGILGGMVKKSKGGVFGNAVQKLYANTTVSPSGVSSIKMNSSAPVGAVIDAIKKTKTSQAVLKPLEALRRMDPNYSIPVRLDANGNITAYDRPEISKKTGNITSTRNVGVLNGDRFVVGRQKRGGGRKLAVSKRARQLASEQLLGTTKTGVVTGQTGTAKPARVTTTSGAPSEKRTVGIGKNETILNKKTTAALKSGKPVFVPGLGRFRMINSLVAGAQDGLPSGQKSGSATGGAGSQSAQLSRAQLMAATEGTSLKEAKRRIAAEGRLTKAMDESTKAQITSKERLSGLNQKVGLGLSAVSGLTIAASFAGGSLGEMAQKIMPFVFGLQGIQMLLPLLKNPLVAAIAIVGAFVVGLKMIDANNKKMAQKQSDYIDSVSGTTEKMKKVGEITGKVGASELMARRRADSAPDAFSKGYDRAGQQFGTNFMGSEVGKEISKGFADSLLTQDRSTAVKQFALQLSAYVSDGVIDGVQAGDIARQLAVDFQDMTLYPSILGQLTTMIGPDGSDLLKDPLKVRIEIIKGQAAVAESFEQDIIQNPGAARGTASLFSFGAGTSERINQTKAASAATAAAYSQSLELAKAQVDATNAQYQKDLQVLETKKNIAKTEKDRITAQAEIDALTNKNKTDNAALGKEIAKILKDQEKAFDKVSNKQLGVLPGQINSARNAFVEASKKQVIDKFKGSQLEEQIPAFLEATKNLDSLDLEIKMNAIAASGTNPVLLGGLMRMFSGDEKELNKQIDLGIKTRGIDETASIVGSLAIIEDEKLQKELFIKINDISDKAKVGDLQSTLTKISEMDEKDFDVNTYLKVNGFEKLNALSEKLRQIQNVPDPITKTTQLENIGLSSEQFQGIISNWEYFMSLPETVRKNAIQTYTVSLDMVTEEQIQAEIAKRVAAAGSVSGTLADYLNSPQGKAMIANQLAMQATEPQYSPSQTPPKTPKETDQDRDNGPGARDTTLDNILNRLKMVREQAINATGGIQELLRVTKGKGLTQFGGVLQDLLKGSPGGINREFLDFINQMDNATRKTYLTEKNGLAVLTAKGKALKEAYDEAIIGEYQYAQQESLDAAQGQLAALQKLKAAGVPTAQAIEMVADAQLAVAINGKDISSKELLKMAADAKKAADELERVGVALKMATPQGRIDIVQQEMANANEYFDSVGALIEQERSATPEYQALTAQIDAQTQAIENANNTIDGYQSNIDTIQRDLETNAVYGSRVIDNLNDQVDTLNRTAEINFDRPIAALNDESNILSNTLSLIDKAEDDINKKYDAQQEALSKISQLNSDIAAQEKQRLTLADALSQGDISAAAVAAQDMRSAAAEAAARNASGTLEAARQAELEGVSVNGMTKIQIQERQFQISQQIFALEQQRKAVDAQILAIQDQIYIKEQLRLPQIAAIQNLQDQIYNVQVNQLIPAQQLLDKAVLAKDAYNKMTEDLVAQQTYLGLTKEAWTKVNVELVGAEALSTKIQKESSETAKAAKNILDRWTLTKPALEKAAPPANTLKGITDQTATRAAALLKSWEALNTTFTTTHIINTIYTSSGTAPVKKMYGGKIMAMNYGGMVPKYMAVGGAVGSDTVPAMLTPGEFVMNKAATKRFGPMLESMNNSKFPSMIKDMTPEVYSSTNSSVVMPNINSMSTTVSDNSSTMYNYNIGITVPQSNANSNDIARAVIGQIKYIDSQRIRGNR
jgi:hypothetical protein